MLTKTGAKLMDFGLAKATPVTAPPPSSGLTATVASPAGSHPLTAQGTVVGTFQYMSPEQLEGKDADARSDIFASRRCSVRNDHREAGISGQEPDEPHVGNSGKRSGANFDHQPAGATLLDHIVRRCLAKNPEERWQSAQDLKLELEWLRQAGSQASAPALARGKRTSSAVLVLAAALVLAVILLAVGYFLFPSKPAPAIWANLNLGGELIDEEGDFALSPDGQKVAYVAATPQGNLKLWVRDLKSPKSQSLEGTEASEFPFWSPDSQSIAFFSLGKLKRINANGEGLQSICDAVNGRGGAWNREGTIVFRT